MYQDYLCKSLMSLNLKIEKGRWTRPKPPTEDLVCCCNNCSTLKQLFYTYGERTVCQYIYEYLKIYD